MIAALASLVPEQRLEIICREPVVPRPAGSGLGDFFLHLTGDVGWGASASNYLVGLNWRLGWGFIVCPDDCPDDKLVRATVFGWVFGCSREIFSGTRFRVGLAGSRARGL